MAFVSEKELVELCFCYFQKNVLAGYKTIVPNAKDAEDAEVAKNVDDPKIKLTNSQLQNIFDTIRCNGCPFKTITNVALREKLTEYPFEFSDIENIIMLSSSQNYQRARMKCKEAPRQSSYK
ncbi:hypothetical protein M0804_014291 [Polistes exclamans]|nr:hypothetical protein M0804_014291 [Polistes exclamans]